VATVYSIKQLDGLVPPAGTVSGLVVPAGTLWVVRALTLVALTAGSTLLVYGDASNLLWAQESSSAGQTYDISTRQVMAAGDFLSASEFSNVSSWYVHISGYQLTLP